MPGRIYTKTGDAGETGLLSGRRVGKDDPRVEAYGDIDELNAVLGLAVTTLEPGLRANVARVQHELFSIGSELAAPEALDNPKIPKVKTEWTAQLEREIDAADAELAPLRHFILPGGSPGAAWLHLARTTCRRAERAIVALSRREKIDANLIVYVNRLSDWLFVMARLANHRAGVSEAIWTAPG